MAPWILGFLFLVPSVFPQRRLWQAKIPFRTPHDCSANRVFDVTLLDCVECSNGTIPSIDRMRCECPRGFYASKWIEGSFLQCADCAHRNESSGSDSRCFGECGDVVGGANCERCSTSECFCERKNSECTSAQPSYVEWNEGNTVTSDYITRNRAKAEALCKSGVVRECHHLANMCVLQNFALSRSEISACDAFNSISTNPVGPSTMPTLFYFSTEASVELYRESVIDEEFNFVAGAEESRIVLVAAVYSLNGTFLGLNTISDTTALQLCPLSRETKKGAFAVGRRYRESCKLSMEEIRSTHPDTVFFDLSIRFRGTDGQLYLYAVPILNENVRSHNDFVNRLGRTDDLKWVLTRRFFLTDYVTRNDSLRVASVVELNVQFQEDHDGHILPPYVRVRYEAIDDPKGTVAAEFSTRYSVLGSRYEKSLEIAMSVLCSVSVLWAAIRAYSWGRRSGKVLMDVTSLVKLVLYAAEILADVFMLVIAVMTAWITFAYKKQQYIAFMLPTAEQEFSFVGYLIAALSLKTVALLHRNLHLALTETFFIDWERSRLVAEISDGPTQISHDFRVPTRHTVAPVIWRTYMVANEWNELQQYRKTSITLQLLVVLFVLQFLHFEEWAVVQAGFSLHVQPPEFESSRFSRFAVNFLVYAAIGFAQWTLNVLVVENVVTDPFHNFIDLCSVANVSVLALTHPLYGFYIHGRSVHGRADTGMLEMNEFLQREANNLVGQRGLESGTELQTFTVSLPRSFRDTFDRILVAHRHSPAETRLSGIDKITVHMDEQVKAHSEMNAFLVEMLSHANAEVDFAVTDARFVESVLDLELGDTTKVGTFVRDPSEVAFSRAFVHGNEWVHLSFEMLLFCFCDIVSSSLILSALVTFLASTAIAKLVGVLFTNNLVKSSLVDHRFLF